MTILSGLAYAVWVLLAFFLWSGGRISGAAEARPAVLLAVPFVLAVFFLLPPGSLPPFCSSPWGGIFLSLWLAASLLLVWKKDAVLPCLVVGCILAVFFWYAYQRGMPGSWANMGTFAAMPVWGIATGMDGAGFALLAAAFILAARSLPSPGLPFCALMALFVTLFLPWNSAPYVRWPVMAVAGCDFLLFWTKIFLCCFTVARIPPSPARIRRLSLACLAAGTAIIAAGML